MPLVPLVLDHNVRNTHQNHSAFGPLAPTRMTSRGGEGADVHSISASADKAIDVADEAVCLLLDVGWFPGNVALLTTGHRRYVQVSEAERLDHCGYWRTRRLHDEGIAGDLLGRGGGLLRPRPGVQGPRASGRRALPQRGHPRGAR